MNIYQKIAEAKAEIGKISKKETNPFFKSKYFDINELLAQVEPIFINHGLLILQPIQENSVCTQIYDIESKESISSCIELPPLPDPQKLGSAITYYRRYSLVSLLSLQAEDDDGNEASKPTSNGKPEVVMLTDEQFEKTKNSNKKQIAAVLNKYNGFGHDMKPAHRKALFSLIS